MAGRRGRKPAVNEMAGAVSTALRFLSVGFKATGNEQARHTWFQGGWGCSFNGVIAAGIPVAGLDFDAYLNTDLLTSALLHVGKEAEFTVLPTGLHITSGAFEAIVPVGDISSAVPTPPDEGKYPLDSAFADAMKIAGLLVSDTAKSFVQSAIVTKPGADGSAQSLFATNGTAIVEAAMGANRMPPNLVMPKEFANAIAKVDAKIVSFGFSAETITVWFDNGGFIRSQLYREAYPPNIMPAADALMTAEPMQNVPATLRDTVAAVAPFGGVTQVVHFFKGKVTAGPGQDANGELEWAASLDVKGVLDGVSVPAKPLLALLDTARQINYGDDSDPQQRVVLYGPSWRAAISAERPALGGAAPVEPEQPPAPVPVAMPWGNQAPAPAPQPQTAPVPQQNSPVAANPWASGTTPAQNPVQPVAAPPAAPAAILPFTPIERQPHMPGAPGWDDFPYQLQPGETIQSFPDARNFEPMRKHGLLGGAPTAPLAGAPAFASPAQPSHGTHAPVTGAAPFGGNAGSSPSNPQSWGASGAPTAAPAQPFAPAQTPAPVAAPAPMPWANAASPSSPAPAPVVGTVPKTEQPWMQGLGTVAPVPSAPTGGFASAPAPEGWGAVSFDDDEDDNS